MGARGLGTGGWLLCNIHSFKDFGMELEAEAANMDPTIEFNLWVAWVLNLDVKGSGRSQNKVC